MSMRMIAMSAALFCLLIAIASTGALQARTQSATASDCCFAGSPCCFPGSPCCESEDCCELQAACCDSAEDCCAAGAECCETGAECCLDSGSGNSCCEK